MKQALYDALVNAFTSTDSNDAMPEPRAIVYKLVDAAKNGDTQATALILKIAEFEPAH